MKIKKMEVTQRPMLVSGEVGYVEGKRLLNPNAEPGKIGEYDALEECTDAELLEHMQAHYGCTDEDAVAKLYDAARRQYNTDRRNAIASDYLNGGVSAELQALKDATMARVVAGEGTPEDFANLKKWVAKAKK